MRYRDKRKSISDSNGNVNIENTLYVIQERTAEIVPDPFNFPLGLPQHSEDILNRMNQLLQRKDIEKETRIRAETVIKKISEKQNR